MPPSRSCTLCHHPLTDAASIEAGIGPVCRSRANDALARTFPARWREAFHMMQIGREKGLLVCAVPEAQATLTSLADAVLMDADAATRSDWRVVIKQAAWVLSHDGIGGRLRCLLQDLAELLGYTATAALWRGEVVIGKASLTFAGRLLSLTSPRPPAEVRDKLREGRWRYDGRAKTWSLWVSCEGDVEAAVQLVSTHFIGAVGVDTAAAAALASLGGRGRAQPVKRAGVELREEGGEVAVATPYSGAFVEALKTRLSPGERRWDGARRVWVVAAARRADVEALVTAHFGA